MKECLMIETKDHNRFFTHEKNLPQLIEFSKAFKAEISKVQIPSETEILELEELAPALCEKKSQMANYKVLEVKLRPKANREKMLSKAKKIQQHIQGNLLSGKTVSLKELNKKYEKYQLTNACLCNHFRLIRKEMESKGRTFVKVGGGKYKLA